jgi:hypothetical protein
MSVEAADFFLLLQVPLANRWEQAEIQAIKIGLPDTWHSMTAGA